ncbi:leucine-rich repeat receptor-like serine/threonine-protein kinase RGI4 [Bidens hawaiensis]|uniref:leucine-rich repeat receptor-like serine/threonine-protein kinase RGI4 n=1 Tax=Bidens hawaiensis TaxID=980011 RepID=UPI00404A176B
MHAPLRNPNNNIIIITITSILFFIFTFPNLSYAIETQGQALIQWKTTLTTPTNVLNSWNPLDSTPCNWVGITCNSNSDVVSIHLNNMNIHGPLPSNLHSLNYLNSITLSSSNLTGNIPKEFGDFLELTEIDISDNSITGSIPSEICRLSKLETFAVSTNAIEGEIPGSIGNLSSLKNLILYDNQLSGEIPTSIGKLRNLEVIRAGGNKNLKGEIPEEIGNCSNLVTLGLAETSISGQLPKSIGKLARVQTIAIYTSLLSGPIPDELGNCSNLRNIYLYQNSISGSIPSSLGNLKRLESLLLWQNILVGSIPSELGTCPELITIDLSENSLTGNIPTSFGTLAYLQELQLSVNKLTGEIPDSLTKCVSITHFEIDNNQLAGEVPKSIGNLQNMSIFFAWNNNITGNIPTSLYKCHNLQAIDLSYNQLYGSIPRQLFSLQNLTKLLLISNGLTGFIPREIGGCKSLYRLRVNNNRLSGIIPLEIGSLKSLNFVDLSNNKLVGSIPTTLSGCRNLEFLDAHSNALSGGFLGQFPSSLKFLDVSDNGLTGPLGSGIGSLTELTKLNLGKNGFSGEFPPEIRFCKKLQMLDVGDNGFSGEIPKAFGQIPSLEIALNLSCSQFTGELPLEFAGLSKLASLDLSQNKLSGELTILTRLQNLVSLNVSGNDFTGKLPDTPFFWNLPASDLVGNRNLYVSNAVVNPADKLGSTGHARSSARLAMSILVSICAVLTLLGIYILVRTRLEKREILNEKWEVTFFQKMDVYIDEIVHCLTSANVIGTGSSGVVYKVTTVKGETFAVKKMWAGDESGPFRSEIETLGSIRHKNIVRLLGWASNQRVKLMFYDYYCNGSLSSLLHGIGKHKVEWETRYEVVLNVAHALAYLHHDCVPSIVHGDVKAMNVLLDQKLQPFLGDFGLARLVTKDGSDGLGRARRPQLAGSYGYMAPEHASARCITEKSDVYSFGVVLLEVLTGRHPLDPTLPGGAHLVQWVRDHLHAKKDPIDTLDHNLKGRANPQMHEMLQTLAVSFLCVSPRPNDRPTMTDVVTMLKEIRHDDSVIPDANLKGKLLANPPSPPPTTQMVLQGSSNCSYAFSDGSV